MNNKSEIDYCRICIEIIDLFEQQLMLTRSKCRKDGCTMTDRRNEVVYTLMLLDLIKDLKKQIEETREKARIPDIYPREWGIYIQACSSIEIIKHGISYPIDYESWVWPEDAS